MLINVYLRIFEHWLNVSGGCTNILNIYLYRPDIPEQYHLNILLKPCT